MLRRYLHELRTSDYRKDQLKATVFYVLGVMVFAVVAGFLFRQTPARPPAGRMGITSDFPHGVWFNTETPPGLFQELRGHVVVILFNDFNSLADLEDINRLSGIKSAFHDQAVACIVVCAGREASMTESLVETWRIEFPVMADPDFEVMANFSVRAVPAVLIIDTASRIAARYYEDWNNIPLEEVIYDLIEQGIATRSLSTDIYEQYPGRQPQGVGTE